MSKGKSARAKARHNARKSEKRRQLTKEALTVQNLRPPPNLTDTQRQRWLRDRMNEYKESLRGRRQPSTFAFNKSQKNYLDRLLNVIKDIPEAQKMQDFETKKYDPSLTREFQWWQNPHKNKTFPATSISCNEQLLEVKKKLPAFKVV